jgi:hypothetical protein
MSVTVKREAMRETIARLERYVSRLERRYEVTSAAMVDDVRSGRVRETAEIGQWLSRFRQLEELQAQRVSKRTTGTHTTHI